MTSRRTLTSAFLGGQTGSAAETNASPESAGFVQANY
jgi:hypothetical protein